MCTVTLLPYKDGFVLTSSRDENPLRETSLPDWYSAGHCPAQELIYPKDKLGGGTWIAASREGRVACLLNGAFQKHEKLDHYKKSRGRIVLESLSMPNPEDYFKEASFHQVEPFTLLHISLGSAIMEFRWDGVMIHKNRLSEEKDYIWSSCTLYEPHICRLRSRVFEEWVTENESKLTPERIFSFHHSAPLNDSENDILMHRSETLQTVSISQMLITRTEKSFKYFDLVNKLVYDKGF